MIQLYEKSTRGTRVVQSAHELCIFHPADGIILGLYVDDLFAIGNNVDVLN